MEDRVRLALQDLFDPTTTSQAHLTCLGGHASLRIYWRVDVPAGAISARPMDTSLMAMVMPLDADLYGSEEGGQTDSQAQIWPFEDVQQHLEAAGLPVPQLDNLRLDIGVVLLEDLGSTHFEDLYQQTLQLPVAEQFDAQLALYKRAIDLLIDAQVKLNTTPDLPETIAYKKSFDAELLRWELDHYTEWGLQAQYGEQNLKPYAERISTIYDQIVEELLSIPQTLVFRDYQSRNIMSKNGALHLIDFQDALLGPCVYDLVALLRDSYIALPNAMVNQLVAYYAAEGHRRGLSWCENARQVKRWFDVQTVQRKLKDAGRFIFIDRVKNNPSFLQYYVPSLHYVHNALRQVDTYRALSDLLGKLEIQWPGGALNNDANTALAI